MPKNNSYSSIEYKEKQRISHLGSKNGMFGKHRSIELINKIRNCDRNKLIGFRYLFKEKDYLKNQKKCSNSKIETALKFIFKDKKYNFIKIKKPGSGLHHPHTIKSRKNMSQQHIKNWKDKNFAERRIYENLHNSLPSSFEKKIITLCNKYLLPFEYCGNGQFIIGFKNPDFINKQEKIVIEVFYSFFKLKKYKSIDSYKNLCNYIYHSNGYSVVFLDENDMNKKDWETICFNKINKYINKKPIQII